MFFVFAQGAVLKPEISMNIMAGGMVKIVSKREKERKKYDR